MFMVCLLSVIRLNGHCRALSTLWPGDFNILKRNSLFGCVDSGLTGADFEEAERFLWRDGPVAGPGLPALVCSTFPIQLLLVSPHFSDMVCFVLCNKAALQVRESRSDTNGEKSKPN